MKLSALYGTRVKKASKLRMQKDWERKNAKNLIVSLNKSVVCPDLKYYTQLWLSCLEENVQK